jgi:hypothetical protein
MDRDTVELDLAAPASQDTDSPLSFETDVKQALIEERKRFDAERQQLRLEITNLKRVNFERDQQMAVALEREKARVNQDNMQMTGELFALRRQLQDQTKLRAELERTQGLLEEAHRVADALREELQAVREQAAQVDTLREELQAVREQAAQIDTLREELQVVRDQAVVSAPEKPAPAAPAFLYEEAEPDHRKHSFHTSGNPIPVRIAVGGDDNDTVAGWVLERSLGGFTLLLDQEMPVGARVRVRNARPNCLLPTWIGVSIKKCQPEGNSFKLICRFIERPTWEEIQQFWG